MFRNRLILCAMMLMVASIASAADPVVLPDTGVDTSGYAAALLTKLGGTISVAIGAGFAIFAIILGVKYIKRLVKG